jgi:hypothetical protein
LYSCGQRTICFVISELIEVVAPDVLKLADQNARFCPFTVGTKGDRADYGFKTVRMDVVGDSVLTQPLCGLDRLPQNLECGIAVRRVVVPEQINALTGGSRLILFQEVLDARKVKARRGNVGVGP